MPVKRAALEAIGVWQMSGFGVSLGVKLIKLVQFHENCISPENGDFTFFTFVFKINWRI